MEYIDVLDKQGNKTGESKPKPDIHRDGDWHRSVHVWVINSKGELLIQQRSMLMDSYPGLWDISAAGHISAGEDSITSALREVEEELGLKLGTNQLINIGQVTQEVVINNGTYFNNEFNDIFIVKVDIDISKIKKQTEEVSEVKWAYWKDLQQEINNGSEGFVSHPEEYDLLFTYLSRNL